MYKGWIISFMFRLVKVRLKRNVFKIVWICVKGIFCSVVMIRELLIIVMIEKMILIVMLNMYSVNGMLGFG